MPPLTPMDRVYTIVTCKCGEKVDIQEDYHDYCTECESFPTLPLRVVPISQPKPQ